MVSAQGLWKMVAIGAAGKIVAFEPRTPTDSANVRAGGIFTTVIAAIGVGIDHAAAPFPYVAGHVMDAVRAASIGVPHDWCGISRPRICGVAALGFPVIAPGVLSSVQATG
jgi:hypothetical protein